MKFLIIVGLVILGLLTNSCNTTTLKRYSSLEESTTNNNLVKISLLPVTISEASQTVINKTAFDLSERGQAALLANKSNEQSFEILNQKFQEQQRVKSKTMDLSSKNVRITFSISRDPNFDKLNFNAFDRIENLKYTFELAPSINNDVKFTKWNKYTTEYGTLDIGTLEYNQSFTANLDVTGEVGANYSSKSLENIDDSNSTESSTTLGPKLSATGKMGYSKSQKENQSVKQRYIQLTGEFAKRKFSIHQQGNRETELAGNVSIDLTLSFPKDEIRITTFSNLFDDKLIRKEAKDVSLNLVRYFIPDLSSVTGDVVGKLSYSYSIRNIIKNANTFVEYDDKIRYINGERKEDNLVLIEKDDLKTNSYYLILGKSTLQLNNSETIQFLDFEQALEFKNWLLQTLKNSKENTSLEISNNQIAFEGISFKDTKINSKDIRIDTFKN